MVLSGFFVRSRTGRLQWLARLYNTGMEKPACSIPCGYTTGGLPAEDAFHANGKRLRSTS